LILTEDEQKLTSHTLEAAVESTCRYQPFPRKVSLYHFPKWILELNHSDCFVA
jgi:hypothetical protein